MKSVVFCPNTGSGILLQNEIYDLQEYLVSYGGGDGWVLTYDIMGKP